jgi:hypothetical protein|tara:strand:+ start:899 stop:1468 length:570 start_codon:yes stop_codon:yes gene_type:complete
MKKFIAKKIITGVSKKFKGVQKIPSQKAPTRFTSVMSEATVKANQRKVLGDVPEFMGLSSRSVGDLASESLALRTANKTFFKSLGKGIRQSRAKTALGIKNIRKTKSVSKPAVFKAKNKGAMKAYKAANIKSDTVFRNTMDKFTGKSKASPFSMKSKVAKRPLRDGTKLRREGDRIIDYQKKLMKDMGF